MVYIYLLHNIDFGSGIKPFNKYKYSLAKMILCSAEPRIISCLPTHVINLVINDNEFEILFIT